MSAAKTRTITANAKATPTAGLSKTSGSERKPAAGKSAVANGGAKKAMSKKPGAKKDAAKKAAKAASKAGKKDAPKKASKPASKVAKKDATKKDATKKVVKADKKRAPVKNASEDRVAALAIVEGGLFARLSEGERAEALRVLIEDPRLSTMANVGRYRVITVEPLAIKPPHGLAGRRMARLVIYDYAADRSIDGCVDLDGTRVTHLNVSRAQPMLAREEEAAAIAIALADERVKEQLSLGEEPLVAMHYWSQRDTNLSFSRRSAAVLFGRRDSRPSLVAVVDLLDNLVCEIVPATQW